MDYEYEIDPQFKKLDWGYSMSNCAYIEGMKLINSNCNCTSYVAEEKMYGKDFCHGKGLHCKLSITRDFFNSMSMYARPRRKCLPHPKP